MTNRMDWAGRIKRALDEVGAAISDFPDDGMDLVERRPVVVAVLMAAFVAVVTVDIVTDWDNSANVPEWCNPAFTVLVIVGAAAVMWQGVVSRREWREGKERDDD